MSCAVACGVERENPGFRGSRRRLARGGPGEGESLSGGWMSRPDRDVSICVGVVDWGRLAGTSRQAHS